MTDEARHLEDRINTGAWVIAHRLHDAFEQAVVEQALEQDGIAFETRLSYDTSFSFLFAPKKGFGVVVVPVADEARAEELISAILAQDERAATDAAQDAEDSVADEEGPAGK